MSANSVTWRCVDPLHHLVGAERLLAQLDFEEPFQRGPVEVEDVGARRPKAAAAGGGPRPESPTGAMSRAGARVSLTALSDAARDQRV